MNALKKIFRPGSTWVRVNHRYPDREDGRIVAPAGTPTRCEVVRVLPDAVAFKLANGSISYLAWPQPPLKVNISPDVVEISMDSGPLLTYTKAPPVSEGLDPDEFISDYITNSFHLIAVPNRPYNSRVMFAGKKVDEAIIPSASRKAFEDMINYCHRRYPFNPNTMEFRKWLDRVTKEGLRREWEVRASNEGRNSGLVNNLRQEGKRKSNLPQVSIDPNEFLSDYATRQFTLKKRTKRDDRTGRTYENAYNIIWDGTNVSIAILNPGEVSDYLNWINLATSKRPFNLRRQKFGRWIWSCIDDGLIPSFPDYEFSLGESVTLSDFLHNGFMLLKDRGKWYTVFWRGESVGHVLLPSWSNVRRATVWLNTAHKRKPFDLSLTNFHHWMEAVQSGRVMPEFPTLPVGVKESEEIDIDINPAEIAIAHPGIWMHRHSLHWWVWESDRRQKVRIWIQLDPSKDYMCWTVMSAQYDSGNARIYKRDMSQGAFVIAIKRACDKVGDYVAKHPKSAGVKGYNFACQAIADELETVQQYRPVYTSDTPENVLKREADDRFWAESIVDKLLESKVTQAAIRIKDGRIFTGPIHCVAVSAMQDQGVLSPEEEDLDGELSALGAEFGWLDEQGRFLTRRQAYKLAVATGQIDDIYGPHKALTHDMLGRDDFAVDIPEGMTFSGSMPMWTMPEIIVKKLLQEDTGIDPSGKENNIEIDPSGEDIDIDPSDVTTSSPETWLQRIPQDRADEGRSWRWWSWKASTPDFPISMSIYTNPESGNYAVAIRLVANLEDDRRIHISSRPPALPVTYSGFLDAMRQATRAIEDGINADPGMSDPLKFAETTVRKNLGSMLIRGSK